MKKELRFHIPLKGCYYAASMPNSSQNSPLHSPSTPIQFPPQATENGNNPITSIKIE